MVIEMQRLVSASVVMLMCAVLPGCSGGGGSGVSSGDGSAPPPAVPGNVGRVSGTLNVGGVLGSAQTQSAKASNERADSTTAVGTVEPDFVPGEIIVRFKPEISSASAIARIVQAYADVRLENRGPIYPDGPYLLRTDAYKNDRFSKKEAQERTRVVVERLKADPAVRYAEFNTLAHAQVTPRDTIFLGGFQWGLRMIGLPAAWELTKGTSDVVVAVLDSGIRADHPELRPLVLPGYDFVSDPESAGDGDGIDADPTEPLSPGASFHGTHVAGTIAASSDTEEGVAGVAWNIRLMPVRVLGSIGDNPVVDVVNGMLYAAGLPNRSGKTPTRPAQVINMSLGGVGQCPFIVQDAIDRIRGQGISVVVAAGNAAEDGNPVTQPASCRGVIAVGAITAQGERASYSTHHPYVFIAAPGGDTARTPLEGIVSTMKVSPTNKPQYIFYQGTSMAAPHVSGVIALMRSINPGLTPDGVETILAQTAIDLGSPNRDPEFGFGLVRADLAVARAASVLPPQVPIPYPQPTLLIFDSTTGTKDVGVHNLGLAPLQLSNVRVATDDGGSWLTAQLLDNNVLRIAVNGSGLAPNAYVGVVGLDANDGSGRPLFVPVIMRLPFQGLPDLGQVTVRLIGLDPETQKPVVRATTTTDRTQGFAYSFPSVAPGRYLVQAGNDKDGSGVFGDAPKEAVGLFPFPGELQAITVEAGKETQNVNFPLIEQQLILTSS